MKKVAAIAVLIWSLGVVPSYATDVFSFAGFTFNQVNTPNDANLLGNGVVLGGATFSASLPSQTPNSINFPQGGGTFDSRLSLGRLTGLSASGVRAVNLPAGNDGTATRHGIEVSWTNAPGMQNQAGADFVVYESGSTSNTVEGVMVRARLAGELDIWTDWYYFVPDGYQVTTSLEVAFSYAFDLSGMGVQANAVIDRIQIANLTANDRISTTTPTDLGNGTLVGEGRVVFDNSTTVRPDAGSFDANRLFDSGNYDPDPLYVAILHDICELSSPNLTIVKSGGQVLVSWPAPSCFTLQKSSSIIGSWADAEESLIVSGGINTATFSASGAAQFFRLSKNLFGHQAPLLP